MRLLRGTEWVVISQKTELFVLTAVKPSNLTTVVHVQPTGAANRQVSCPSPAFRFHMVQVQFLRHLYCRIKPTEQFKL
jgi:hypothetical protein